MFGLLQQQAHNGFNPLERLMRLTSMRRFLLPALLFAFTFVIAAPARAQFNAPTQFKDTSMIKPPVGSKVAIWEFEDLECPACAHAYPIVHAAIEKYHLAFVRHDFPLPMHIWSFDAAVWARYLQDKVSPKTADDYRGAVFAAQAGIASKDDMLSFTRKFFQSHGLQMPFVSDPTGQLTKEVEADRTLGDKLGVQHTPTIVVCTQRGWVHVTDVSLLYQTIDQALAEPGSGAPAKKAAH